MKKTLLFMILFLWALSDYSGLSSTAVFERVEVFQFPTTIFRGDSVGGSDVWGWTGDDGTEYALMGVLNGIAGILKLISIMLTPYQKTQVTMPV